MNRDPFDSLRSRDPAPPESLPGPPMEVARAITSGRPSLRRGLAVAAGAAAVVLVGGGSWLLWSRGGTVEMAAETTTTTAAASTTLAPGLYEAPILTVYFLDPEGATLVPVARDLNVLNVRPLPDLGPLTLELLLWGPGPWDAGPLPEPVAAAEAALTTAIPEGSELLSVEIAQGVAVVDLSAQFAAAPPQAIAQVVFTATRLAGVAEVRFLIEGVPQVVASRTSGLFTPYLAPAATTSGLDSIGRGFLSTYLPPVMIESPALGSTLSLPGEVSVLATGGIGDILLQIVGEDGLPLWSGTLPACSDCAAGDEVIAVAALPATAAPGTGWATLRAYLSSFDRGPFAEVPVWLIPYAPATDEPDLPEATTTTPTTTPTATIPGRAAPWSGPALAADAVPAIARETWTAAENREACPLLFPTDPESLAPGAVLHDRYFGGGWGLAWDLPAGPGRWQPGGEYCPDCGREAFGVAGAVGEARGDEDVIWPHRLAWTEGAGPGPVHSHAGYGYEGVTSGDAGEPLLAYLFVGDEGCLYNVWSYLGEEHLLALIDQLRFVEGAGNP